MKASSFLKCCYRGQKRLLYFLTSSFFPCTNCSPCRLLHTFLDDSLRWVTMVWYKIMQWPKRMQLLSKSWAVYERCNPMWVRSRQDFVRCIQITEYKLQKCILVHHTLSYTFPRRLRAMKILFEYLTMRCHHVLLQQRDSPIMVLVLSSTRFRSAERTESLSETNGNELLFPITVYTMRL